MIRFLHAGDLHLGSSFAAFSPKEAARRREGQFAALEALIADARRRDAAFLLFAGDCFDSDTPDADTVRRFFDLLGSAALPALIAPGNHDPYREGGLYDAHPLPQNVCLFKERTLAFFALSQLGVNVYGYAFTAAEQGAPRLPRREELPPDAVNILLAHADLTASASPYAPISAEALAASGFAYAALGHIHKPMAPRRLGDTVVAYSGFLAGRGFDEPGMGQANLVEIDGGRVTVLPLASEAARFEILTLDCTGAAHGEALRALAARFLEEITLPDETAVRLVLTGEVAAGCTPDAAALARLGARFALFEIKDETLPLYNPEFLKKDPGLRGAFYRAMLPRLESPDANERATAVEALRIGFAALSGRGIL